MDAATATLIGLILTAAGWLSREIWRYRKAKRQAGSDATEILRQRKAHLEDMISKVQGNASKERLRIQLDETDAALLGLYSQRLRRALKDAGIPPVEMLAAESRRWLNPQQVAHLKEVIVEVSSLPSFLSIEDLFVLGSAYYYVKLYEEAKTIYDRIISLNCDDDYALNGRALAYSKLRLYDYALTDLDRALLIKPSNPTVLMNRGVIYLDLERYEEALADFNLSLKINPDDPMTLNNRAVAYMNLKRYDDALTDLNRSLGLYEHPTTLRNRGSTYYLLGRYEEALGEFSRSLTLRPDEIDCISNLAMTYYKLGRYREAITWFNDSLKLNTDDPPVFYKLACVFSLIGNIDEAIVYLEKAIDKDKKYRKKARADKDFDNIRGDPRFKKLVESE